ncbi:amino acid carrier protein [Deinococcus proteolyticus MRP]|uniref:Amino acid carrier protein n=1 Tax=Deinococcus proteolyticus (strain ATCC 35074 / DSM 20540 / JCM 6276 / NBRC 101906 / NCIMB 13154 / VKM Ac-1939 / CCM 2703 / MRP) TaxID=693977 RepID=F0RL19_DEIPM|nr:MULTISPECIES: alanine/glycine:cation symporter family protein [Deinococcus]ADY25792.1 amino acid carrier protein [Deinococcus proteolyticus MRP]MCY1701916.1 alanine/glycine:cation symporter family protein [Deinococcus sp. SL84]
MFETLINTLNGWVWSPALIYLCLGVGLYFSVRTRFLQVRHFGEMLRLLRDGQSSNEGVSSFQALAMALAGRVGTGNIAGVATAITFGGPGALFWMWMVAFLGASTAYIESVLGQIYKEKDSGGHFVGGPAYYFEKGLGQKWYGVLFAISAAVACGLLLPGVQANSIATAMTTAMNVPTEVTAGILAIVLGFIIFGGVKRIASVAEIVVPFMAGAYILVSLVIVLMNIGQLPETLSLIFRSAFGADAAFGAIIGQAVAWGVKRGVYSNEAGQGTGPHPAAAANVSHPAKQGLVQAFSVYVDTLLVCSATGFMLLTTGFYNVQDPGNAEGFLHQGVQGVAAGPGYVQTAMENIMPGVGSIFVAVALFLFAFTTILAYYYIAETNIRYLSRSVKLDWALPVLKLVLIGMVVYGCLRTADLAWAMGDLGVGLMAWLNIIGILFLQKPALATLHDYEAQKRAGRDPIYDAEANGVHNAPLWTEIRRDFESRRS